MEQEQHELVKKRIEIRMAMLRDIELLSKSFEEVYYEIELRKFRVVFLKKSLDIQQTHFS